MNKLVSHPQGRPLGGCKHQLAWFSEFTTHRILPERFLIKLIPTDCNQSLSTEIYVLIWPITVSIEPLCLRAV